MSSVLWQPSFSLGYNFNVLLDRDFARAMATAAIGPAKQQKMNELGSEELQRLGTVWPDPFIFHQESALVTQFYLGQNGVWLALDDPGSLTDELYSKPIEYHSHNVDTTKQVFDLQYLFDVWVKYADILKEK